MKITTLIIDDEPLARQRIRNLLTDISEIEILDECATGKKAIKAIESNKPDLIFLDIQLKDMTGFNVLEKIDNALKPIVVFITAYNEYALKAFDSFLKHRAIPYRFQSSKYVLDYSPSFFERLRWHLQSKYPSPLP